MATLFQSTPPRGRRLQRLNTVASLPRFQSTPPRGRRRYSALLYGAPRSFNPRLRAGGDAPERSWRDGLRGFNPRLRAGGDPAGEQQVERAVVSIHASAREATTGWLKGLPHKQFQSTPPRGRRQAISSRSLATACFNPRLRAGGDMQRPSECATKNPFQSTPPRGRRPPGPRYRPGGACFNPRLRAGGDYRVARAKSGTRRFQSTPPRGRRRRMPRPSPPHPTFQSTPPRGRRHGGT